MHGNALVFDKAAVYGKSKIFGEAQVYGKAKVSGNAQVYGVAFISDEAHVNDNAKVFGNFSDNVQVYGYGEICGDAIVQSRQDYIVFKNFWSSGRYFTWTRSNNMWKVGCFYGTGEELIKKAYKDSEISGREYKRIVEYVEHCNTNSNIIVRLLKKLIILLDKPK